MTKETWVWGWHAVTAAVQYEPQRIRGIWFDRNRRDKRAQSLATTATMQGINTYWVSSLELDQFSAGRPHQGVVARCKVVEAAYSEKDLTALLSRPEPALLLVLDGVQDPHNLGACLRSADAAGVQAVIIPTDRAVGLTPTVRKVACGAAETVPCIPVTNLVRTLKELKTHGVWIVGADGEAAQSLYQMDFTPSVALVLGAEDKGLRRLTRETCDFLAAIPLQGQVESLNVSVAAGIFLFEVVRQRQRGRHDQ